MYDKLQEVVRKYQHIPSLLGNLLKHNYLYSAYFPRKFCFSEVVSSSLVCFRPSIIVVLFKSTGRLPQPDLNRTVWCVQSPCAAFFRPTSHDEIILLCWWPSILPWMFTSLDIRKGNNNSLPFSFTTKLFKLLFSPLLSFFNCFFTVLHASRGG